MRSACAGSLTGIRHIDWAADSAFRFFPIERDPLMNDASLSQPRVIATARSNLVRVGGGRSGRGVGFV